MPYLHGVCALPQSVPYLSVGGCPTSVCGGGGALPRWGGALPWWGCPTLVGGPLPQWGWVGCALPLWGRSPTSVGEALPPWGGGGGGAPRGRRGGSPTSVGGSPTSMGGSPTLVGGGGCPLGQCAIFFFCIPQLYTAQSPDRAHIAQRSLVN